MLMLAILGIVDARSPGDFAGIVIGGAVIAIIMVIGPVTGASLNPARAFGPELVSAIGGGATHWTQLIPVYVAPRPRRRRPRSVRLRLPRHAAHHQRPDQGRRHPPRPADAGGVAAVK